MFCIDNGYRGSICEIRSNRNELLAVSVISEIGEDYIKVRAKGSRMRLFDCGMDLKISIYNHKLGLMVLICACLTSTRDELKVVDIYPIVNQERRTHFRVEAEIIARISRDKTFEESKKVVIKDISLCGLLIMTTDKIDIDEYKWIELNVDGRPMSFEFHVIREFYDDNSSVRKFGCEIDPGNGGDGDKLCAYIFKLQRQAVNNNKY